MSIQFMCVSCARPIEVDSAWALKLVECPYCHDTVTAPGMTTYRPGQPDAGDAAAAVPTARPALGDSGWSGPVAGAAPRAPGRNMPALVALGLAVTALVVFLWLSSVLARELMKGLGPEPQPAQLQSAFQEAAQRGDPWVGRWLLGMLVWFGLWLAAFVCAVVGLCRRGGRRVAIAALVLALSPVLLGLLQLIVQ